MKLLILLLAASGLVIGCATNRKGIENRKRERATAFDALAAWEQEAVTRGQLRHGMDTNAAYIAWGQPSEILSEGGTTQWVYRATRLREEKTTTWQAVQSSSSIYALPAETRTLYPEEYQRARILFEEGRVKEWQINPKNN